MINDCCSNTWRNVWYQARNSFLSSYHVIQKIAFVCVYGFQNLYMTIVQWMKILTFNINSLPAQFDLTIAKINTIPSDINTIFRSTMRRINDIFGIKRQICSIISQFTHYVAINYWYIMTSSWLGQICYNNLGFTRWCYINKITILKTVEYHPIFH